MKENPARVAERAMVEDVLRNHRDSRGTQRVSPKRTSAQSASGLVGSASELVCCADLLRRGWYAFRSASHQSPVDVIAMKGPVLLRVEVRTSTNGRTCKMHGTYDILAMVKDSIVIYRPDLPLVESQQVVPVENL
jgi:hypothetical protein